jgi:hypothetical protein
LADILGVFVAVVWMDAENSTATVTAMNGLSANASGAPTIHYAGSDPHRSTVSRHFDPG